MKWRRVVGAVGAGGALALLLLALEGGEYSARDLRHLRRQVARERETIRRLMVEVDSLARFDRALRYDSATQERVAREAYGLIRDGEILYRIVPAAPAGPPDSEPQAARARERPGP